MEHNDCSDTTSTCTIIVPFKKLRGAGKNLLQNSIALYHKNTNWQENCADIITLDKVYDCILNAYAMEKLTKGQADALNDLIRINNDRMTGYERAIDYLNDENNQLKVLLSDFVDQSLEFKMQLKELLHDAGEKVEDGTTLGGKLYHAWMDVKAAFTGGGPKEVLKDCVIGEDAAQGAYDDALDQYLPEGIRAVLVEQRDKLNTAYGMIKNLSDAAE